MLYDDVWERMSHGSSFFGIHLRKSSILKTAQLFILTSDIEWSCLEWGMLDQPLSQQSANGFRCITQDVLELSAIDAWLQNLRSHTHTPHTTDIILGKEVCNEINETFEYIWYIWIDINLFVWSI